MQQHFWNNAKDVLHQFDDNHPQKVMSIAPNLSSTASSISTVVVRFPPKPTIHIAFDQSYQHPIDKITMQTFGTAVIDHILHHIVHKVLVAYGFEKPSCRFNLQNSPCKLKSGGDRQRESLGCFQSPETKMPADLKDQLAFLFAHKENALLRFYKYNKYTKHNSIPTKHLKIMFFDKVH